MDLPEVGPWAKEKLAALGLTILGATDGDHDDLSDDDDAAVIAEEE